MNKTELVDMLADKADMTKADSGRILDAFIDVVTSTLQEGEQVVLPGFGTFSVGNRAARTGRNPQTGETIEIKAARVAKFKVGKSLKEAVQADAVVE